MDNSRLFLWVSFGLICFLLWDAWLKDYQPTPGATAGQQIGAADDRPAAQLQGNEDDLPSLGDVSKLEQSVAEAAPVPETETTNVSRTIRVTTDVLDIHIATQGGDLVEANILPYPVKKDQPDVVVQTLNSAPRKTYIVQSGLLAAQGASADHRAQFTSTAQQYELAPGQETLKVVLKWSEGGDAVSKTYTFARGSYTIGLKQQITPQAAWRGAPYIQIKRSIEPQKRSFFDVDSYSFDGPVYFDGEKYEKLKLKDLRKHPLDASLMGGWIASIQHHFVTAAVLSPDQPVRYTSRLQQGDVALLSAVGDPVAIAPGQSEVFEHRLFVGPKLQKQLAAVAPKLNKVVDYGFLAILSEPLFWLLQTIHGFVGNWGWAIILLTILIKLVFYKLTETSGRSMAKMRELQPRLKALQERYKDDRQQLSQAMMELYKREGANPMAGCLPILIQMPVFLALYWVLIESVELRQAPWAFWINDLSVKDPFFILPILMGATMVVQQRLNPTPTDPIQARVAAILPVVMTVFFAFFPAGLVLYWFVNTLLSVAQQWHINRALANKKK